MTRPLRVLYPGAIYHVCARGNERRAIFGDEADFSRFLDLLEQAIARHDWLCLGYCLMHNHYHLIVQTPKPNLPSGMRHLNGCYAQDFNRRHGRVGHLFEGRYTAVLVEAEAGFFRVVRYVARNPVRAGICARPQDWRWSSYAAAIGIAPAPAWLAVDVLLAAFGGSRENARRELRAYVEGEGPDPNLEAHGVILGSREFIRAHSSTLRPLAEVPRAHWQPIRPDLPEIFADGGDPITLAYREWGYTMHEIAEHLGCHYSTISRRLRERERLAGLVRDCKT